MRIDSMDATITTVKPQQQREMTAPEQAPVEKTEPQGSKNTEPTKDELFQDKHFYQLSELDRGDLNISEKAIIDAIERANKAALGRNTSFRFSIHEATKRISIKVLDADTNEIIREIPPEKVLDMVAKMWEMAGLFVDERR